VAAAAAGAEDEVGDQRCRRSMSGVVPDPATVLTAYLREAVAASKLAYQFSANSSASLR
jgi:hypothetical protein